MAVLFNSRSLISPLRSHQEMEIRDVDGRKRGNSAFPSSPITFFLVSAAAFAFALFRDSAANVFLAEGLSVTSEFSILSEMLCDLSVSIRKKRLYLRGEKTKKRANTHIHFTNRRKHAHTFTHLSYINRSAMVFYSKMQKN